MDDAIGLAAYLRLHPEVKRPQVPEMPAISSDAISLFTDAPSILDELPVGTEVVFLSNTGSDATLKQGKVVSVQRVQGNEDSSHPQLVVGMRLEAKDRLNPSMICLFEIICHSFN
jgi:hypothetical protein